jgi:recombinational DNA repair ATPase RecF
MPEADLARVCGREGGSRAAEHALVSTQNGPHGDDLRFEIDKLTRGASPAGQGALVLSLRLANWICSKFDRPAAIYPARRRLVELDRGRADRFMGHA